MDNLAEEVIIVDSESSDGTVEKLRAGLKHPRIRFLTHPPGLYQSWNFGVRNAATTHVYIATVADSIAREGIEHLLEVARKFRSDVVMSKPSMASAAGEPIPDSYWPIDQVLESLGVRGPVPLTPLEQFLFASINTGGALLGSSASNLYATACLKARPFPTDFGAAGDCAWGIINAFDVSIAVTPRRFSTFREHEKSHSQDAAHLKSLVARLFDLTLATAHCRAAENSQIAALLVEMRWPELESLLVSIRACQAKLEQYRKRRGLWYLNPTAWHTRRKRINAERRIQVITSEVLVRRDESQAREMFPQGNRVQV